MKMTRLRLRIAQVPHYIILRYTKFQDLIIILFFVECFFLFNSSFTYFSSNLTLQRLKEAQNTAAMLTTFQVSQSVIQSFFFLSLPFSSRPSFKAPLILLFPTYSSLTLSSLTLPFLFQSHFSLPYLTISFLASFLYIQYLGGRYDQSYCTQKQIQGRV